MDRVLLVERVTEYITSTYKYQLPPTVTLYAPMVVPCTDRALFPARVTGDEYVYSMYNCQVPTTLTFYAPIVVFRMERVLLSERVMEEDVTSMYKYQ